MHKIINITSVAMVLTICTSLSYASDLFSLRVPMRADDGRIANALKREFSGAPFSGTKMLPGNSRRELAKFSEAELNKFDIAVMNYCNNVAVVEKEYGATKDVKKRDAGLFAIYCKFIERVAGILNPRESVCIYPVSGPDISFQICMSTFALNIEETDIILGKRTIILTLLFLDNH